MISKVLLLVGASLLCTGIAMGQSGNITVDLVTGLQGSSADTLALGGEATFYIRVNNNTGFALDGITNGYRVYSDDGANWDTVKTASLGTITAAMFDGSSGLQMYPNDQAGQVNGSISDTVGFGGFRFFSAGLPAGFDDTAYTITIGPIGGGSIVNTTTICVDSAYYGSAGTWKWAAAGGNDFFPAWGGPYCYFVEPDPADVKVTDDNSLPTTFSLGQNYPNPFNPSSSIAFDLPIVTHVRLTVYNVLGQEVTTLVDEKLGQGSYEAEWNGRSSSGNHVSSGIYFYRLHTEQFTQTKKMVLLK
ncbi:MAG: T9SS type A sorting domain-containing protein [candidate division Zixibacteria bacterium]|nr:T9SS type A sorting domain-containing protein [candidate division Zixibacteria bacterium]MDH3937911.1 T9SS type A sorting domain-containing protein [candidate division Zixibacteria bacterium]MDH4033369.1 T9SS type A sorting domain-containing protein [candidate division Zixibacteria bacterium]